MAFWKTTVGKKYIVGITGLIWAGFVLTHMAGNMLIFVSGEAYNKYGHALTSTPLIYVAEAILVFALGAHVWFTLQLAAYNKASKPIDYSYAAKGAKKTDWITKTMWIQGPLILFFIVVHLNTFKFGDPTVVAVYDGVEMRDLHRLVVEAFLQPGYVIGYLVALVLLGVHLKHGFASTFQSLGLINETWRPRVRAMSLVYGLVVSLGFLSQPLYIFFVMR